MTIKIYKELEQGSDEWFAARCGVLTASQMKLVITPSLKIANNDKTKAHVYELAAQRISEYVEPSYLSEDMMRGNLDEILARELYHEKYAKVKEVGFITNSRWPFTLGYSPDGLVGRNGLIEIKSRRQKFQIETVSTQEVPKDFVLQIQTALLVSGRKWCDYISYSGGLPMATIRVLPDRKIQAAILWGAYKFHQRINAVVKDYHDKLANKKVRLIPTERIIDQGDEIEC